jgi:hypothetical protein
LPPCAVIIACASQKSDEHGLSAPHSAVSSPHTQSLGFMPPPPLLVPQSFPENPEGQSQEQLGFLPLTLPPFLHKKSLTVQSLFVLTTVLEITARAAINANTPIIIGNFIIYYLCFFYFVPNQCR